MLRSLRMTNLLSFKDTTVTLDRLNLLIGANASGKSNLIACIGLLQAAPKDLNRAIRQGGGVHEWIWKSSARTSEAARIECSFEIRANPDAFQYHLEFAEQSRSLAVQSERLVKTQTNGGNVNLLSREGGRVELGGGLQSPINVPDVAPSASALATFLTPLAPPLIGRITKAFDSIAIYREFDTSVHSSARAGVSAGFPGDVLDESGDNLAMVLNRMDVADDIAPVNEYLRRFSEQFHDVKAGTEDNIVRLQMKEIGLAERISGIRLSDGTLKFLCLLVVLLQREPPPLICIEEPEIGLHPDAIQLVAEALVEASSRTQLLVTTHSEVLVDAMSARPESVLVCERDFDSTTGFRRLDSTSLKAWLERYKLGQLWRLGEIGGTRW